MTKIGAGYQGASIEAIRHHYDAGNEFYQLWLDPSLTYSCACWADTDADDDLESAQMRKLDYHITQARAEGADRVLDVGCGWGSLTRRLVERHRVHHAVGLTLSQAQFEWLGRHSDDRIEIRLENWFDHRPERPYDALLAVASFEAFASPHLSRAQRINAYSDFFARCHQWLVPGGRMSMQTIAWGSASRRASSGFIEREIFPDSDLPTLEEIAAATSGYFETVLVRNDRIDYERTALVWFTRLRRIRPQAVALVGENVVRRYEKYLKLARIAFHTGKLHLYRITLCREPDRIWQ